MVAAPAARAATRTPRLRPSQNPMAHSAPLLLNDEAANAKRIKCAFDQIIGRVDRDKTRAKRSHSHVIRQRCLHRRQQKHRQTTLNAMSGRIEVAVKARLLIRAAPFAIRDATAEPRSFRRGAGSLFRSRAPRRPG